MENNSKRSLRTKASSNLSMCQDDYLSHKPSKKLREEMDKLCQVDVDSNLEDIEERKASANSQFNVRRYNIARSDFARQGSGFIGRPPRSSGIPFKDVQKIYEKAIDLLIKKMKENLTLIKVCNPYRGISKKLH